MVKIKRKVVDKVNQGIDRAMRETYEQEASRALNEAVSCPVHGSMDLRVTLNEDNVAEVSGVPCCEKGKAAVEKAIKE